MSRPTGSPAAGKGAERETAGALGDASSHNAAGLRPSEAQRRYLERGLTEPGGKLPLFDRDGREVPRKTVESCVTHGWATPWQANPIMPEWLVCRLTPAGCRALGAEPPGGAPAPQGPQRRR